MEPSADTGKFHSVNWNLLLGYRVHPFFGIYTELDVLGPGKSGDDLSIPVTIYFNFIPKLHFTYKKTTFHLGFGIGLTKCKFKYKSDTSESDTLFSMKIQTGIHYAVTEHFSIGLDFDYLPILYDGSVTDHGINLRPNISYRF